MFIHAATAALAALTLLLPQNALGQQQGSQQQAQHEQHDERNITTQLQQREPPEAIRGQQPVQMVLVRSADEIVRDPDSVYGARVSVHAQIADVVTSHHFRLDDDPFWPFGDDLTVIVPKPAGQAALTEDTYVTVIGTVVPFVRAEFERDYDWFDSLPDIEVDLEGRPVLVADVARTSDGVLLTQEQETAATRVLIADAGDIADTPGRFYGQTVSVRAEVEEVRSDGTFALDEDEWFAGPDVLVFNPFPAKAGMSSSLEDEVVTVIGVVRPFVLTEFEQDYGWFTGTDSAGPSLETYERRPVIVASSITRSGQEYVRPDPSLALDKAGSDVQKRASGWADQTTRSAQAEREPSSQPSAGQPSAGESAARPRGADMASSQDRQEEQPDQPDRDRDPAQASTQYPVKAPITDLTALQDGKPADTANRTVRIQQVKVVRSIDDRTYLVGTSEDEAIVVRLATEPSSAIEAGRTVELEGIVREAAAGSGDIYVEALTFE